jgi:trans-2,3-dihydro-3-hydroxyanthranilate isomerase
MPRRYHVLDVFTNRPLAGNQLAVVTDTDDLDSVAMQSIAREFNLAETVFVLPPEHTSHRARLRIFTPMIEMPFAGHPTIGTAVLLGHLDGITGETQMILGEAIGPVACVVKPGSARFKVPGTATFRGEPASIDTVATALGLDVADIGYHAHRVTMAGVGLPFTFVPVADRATLARIAVNTAVWEDAFGKDGFSSALVYAPDAEGQGHHWRARMFAPLEGIPEDPATGSAAAAFTAVIAAFDSPADGTHRFVIEQGFEMGRPSLIGLTMAMRAGECEAAHIDGEAVIIADGFLHV